MKQAVGITVRSQFGLGEEHEETLHRHTGSIILSERGMLLSYSTDEPCDVQISATHEHITIRRKGAVESTMVLHKGCTHPFAYTTAMGTLRLGVHTHDLHVCPPKPEAAQPKGEITAGYALMHEGTVVSEHRLHIVFELL